MNNNEHLKEELSQIFNNAASHRRKQILESIEYKLAMKDGDIAGAYQFAYGLIFGSGKTKAEARRSQKRIKKREWLDKITS